MATLEKIVENVRQLAREHPTKRYKSVNGVCSYFHDAEGEGKGHRCIIGEALAKSRALHLLKDREELYSVAASEVLVDILSLNWRLTDEQKDQLAFLNAVQSFQDEGKTWGQAVDLAGKECS